MNERPSTNDEQATLWNGPSGQAWVELQPMLDQLLAPFEDLLVRAVTDAKVARVLDVGCGTGSTTLAIARTLGPTGTCTGVDLSEPMLAVARQRAAREGSSATFTLADAQAHAFEPGSFDMIVSRFGVMFFADFVAAFANLRRALRSDGALRFIAWRSPAENPFFTTVERAVAPFLPEVPARRPDGPGQFAFADGRKVRQILEASGWTDIELRPIDVPCTMREADLVTYLTRLGPVGAILREAGDELRTKIVQAARSAFDPYVHGDEARFTAACWLVGARSPATATG